MQLDKQTLADLELTTINGTHPVTTARAAHETGVSPAVIRDWARRGRLTPLNPTQGAKLYNLDDVFNAERTRRDRPPV